MAVQTDAAATPTRAPNPVVGAQRSPRLAARVARQIEADIAEAGWPVGQVFGGEDELRERYGVSRAVVREAIRLVEHHEVATMRRGRSGGLIVRAPDVGALTAAIVIYLEYVGTTVEDLLAVRMLLEPLAARLAAERMPESGIAALREALRGEQSLGALAPAGRDLLHVTLSRMSGNTALDLFITVLIQLTARYAQRPADLSSLDKETLSEASDKAHTAIVDAIIGGNAAQAEYRTIRHLEAMRTWLISVAQRPISRSPRSGSATRDSKQKLAETVARRVIADIVDRGAAVGDVIGTEPELLRRLDVSRAVFREAVRILEYHSVARTRRGPGGGLVVTEPDPTASIESMAIYLDYQKIGVEDLRAVRSVIELGSLDLVTRRRDDPEVVRRLRGSLRIHPDSPPTHGSRAHLMHTEIAELSDNPILALFLRIITTLWQRHLDQAPPAALLAEDRIPAAVDDVHDRIVEAILAGDLPLAQHRMSRHLTALSEWWH